MPFFAPLGAPAAIRASTEKGWWHLSPSRYRLAPASLGPMCLGSSCGESGSFKKDGPPWPTWSLFLKHIQHQDCMRILGAVSRVDNWGDQEWGWGLQRERSEGPWGPGPSNETLLRSSRAPGQRGVECVAWRQTSLVGSPAPLLTYGLSGAVLHLPTLVCPTEHRDTAVTSSQDGYQSRVRQSK